MKRYLAVAGALAVVLGIPFLLQPAEDLLSDADETLVVLTPHNEAIRYEFSRAFRYLYR